MKTLLRLAPVLLLAISVGCSSAPSDEDDASRLEDFRNRASNYYNSARYEQAYQQAVLGLEIDEDDGGLNLIAGRALLLQRDLMKVAHAFPYLERAQDNLDNYKSDYSMAEFHYRYGSMLLDYAREQADILKKWPREDPQQQEQEVAANQQRRVTAQEHLLQAQGLLGQVLEVVPEDNNALEMAGQVAALQGDDGRAIGFLGQALDLLLSSPTPVWIFQKRNVFIRISSMTSAGKSPSVFCWRACTNVPEPPAPKKASTTPSWPSIRTACRRGIRVAWCATNEAN